MDRIVIKLGGTSQCKIAYDNLIKLVSYSSNQYVIVLSAVNKVTNDLINFINTKNKSHFEAAIEKNINLCVSLNCKSAMKKLIESVADFEEKIDKFISMSDEHFDYMYLKSEIVGFGEVMSTTVFKEYISDIMVECNVKIEKISSYKIIKAKDETFKFTPSVEFFGDYDAFDKMEESKADIIICEGFIASTPSNRTILLGRGGSDTTGAIIADMINAKEYQVWTDVDGIYSADPNTITNAKIIPSIGYHHIQELSAMGAKVMHPLSILPCVQKKIPIKIVNSKNEKTGTEIVDMFGSCPELSDLTDKSVPVAVAVQNGVTVIKIKSLNMWGESGFVADIFDRFSKRNIDVNIITTSQFSISTTTDEKNKIAIEDLVNSLRKRYDVNIIENCSIVSIVTPCARRLIDKIKINEIKHYIFHSSSNDMSLSFVVDSTESIELAKSLHTMVVQ